MADITLSKAVRSNLLNLQSTANQLGKTQERLATGLKVNSALDNPTNFFTASSLNSRAGDLGRLLDAVGNATQTIEAANNGLTAITSLVESAQATARQALQTTGAQTTNEIVGDSGALYNPEALTSVAGTGASITADAAATVATVSIGADVAQADFDFDSADLGDNNTVLNAVSGTPFATGDIISIEVNGTATTIGFKTDSGTAATGADTDVLLDGDVASLATALDGISGISASATAGVITIETDAGTDTIKFTDSAGDALTGLAFTGAHAATDDGSGNDFYARNADLQALIATGADTLDVTVGSTAQTQIDLGAGNVASKEALLTALDGLSDITATGSASAAGAITLTNSTASDADSSIVLTAGTAATAAGLFTSVDTVGGAVQTTAATNLLSQSAVSQGDVLEITVGDSTKLSITFGTTSSQVSTLAELNTALQNLAGGSASADATGNISITSDAGGDNITIGGDSAAVAAFGLTAGEASTLIDGTNISASDTLSIQIGSHTALTVTFGTATGQVNTLDELETALSNLQGGSATIDTDTGAITIEATSGTDSIVVTGSDSGTTDLVANYFGLSSGTQTSTTTNSTTRATLETQYNDLLTQINELAEDASFNGVNLLDGNDLNVIFNEDGSSKLDIRGVTFDAAGLGLNRVSSNSFQTDSNINTVLSSLDSAITSLRSQATTFGSNLSVVETRQDFTKSMINTLETGGANLTLADSNEEAANLLALQTRQQLSSTALSLASQADQNVLRLF